MKIQSLELRLAEEQRNHAETMRQRNALEQRVNGFERMSRSLAGRVDDLSCEHLSVFSDNYGSTCSHCSKQLEGYGYGGWFGSNLDGTQRCIHRFVLFGDHDSPRVCQFCEMREEKIG